MTQPSSSRLGAARRRALAAKRAIAVASAAAFAVALVLARASHPGQVASKAGSSGAATATRTDDGSFAFGSGSIAPSSVGSAPEVQSSGS